MQHNDSEHIYELLVDIKDIRNMIAPEGTARILSALYSSGDFHKIDVMGTNLKHNGKWFLYKLHINVVSW